MDLVAKTRELMKDYLKRFKPREVDEVFEKAKEIVNSITSPDSDLKPIKYNEISFRDLEIDGIARQIYCNTPNQKESTGEYTTEFFKKPIQNIEELIKRQDIIEELTYSEELNKQVEKVKIAADVYAHDRIFEKKYRDSDVQELENIKNFVLLINRINDIGEVKSEKLQLLKTFAKKISEDKGFQQAEMFIQDTYIPYNLGNVLAEMNVFLYNKKLNQVENRREFYSYTKLLEEATGQLFNLEYLEHFWNKREGLDVGMSNKLKEFVELYKKNLFGFKGDLYSFQEDNNGDFIEFREYWMSVVQEALNSKLPPQTEITDLPEELGVFLGIANYQREIIEKGISLTRPVFADQKDKKAEILNGHNLTLIKTIDEENIVSNNVVSDKDKNLFIITGPNNGGKTTYLRQVGQAYWTAHLGMLLAAEKAELSPVDGIFTSISHGDNTLEGEGQYLYELKNVSEFTNPNNGRLSVTPYSLLLFDEFANGTDNAEGVERTKVVLEHLDTKGVTAYFTSHKPEIAEMVEQGKFLGAVNLACEAQNNGKTIITTFKVLRDAKEKSYGHVQAEALDITPDGLRKRFDTELKNGLYSKEDTRISSHN